jgi:hypothetical protein
MVECSKCTSGQMTIFVREVECVMCRVCKKEHDGLARGLERGVGGVKGEGGKRGRATLT